MPILFNSLASRRNGYMYSNGTSLNLALFILMANHFLFVGYLCNRPTAEKANFESLISLVSNLLSVKVFDKNRKI